MERVQPVPDEEAVAHRRPATLDAPLGASEDDAAEQSIPADPSDDAGLSVDLGAVAHRGWEVGEWDAAEQVRDAGLDDDYR